MSLNPQDLFLIVIAAIFIMSEWKYRAKRDGKAESTKAMVFAMGVFVVGISLQNRWGMQGLLFLAIGLLAATIFFMWRRRQLCKVEMTRNRKE